MKLALRILNFVIMAISLAATVFLFAYPTFSFNSNIGLDVVAFSKFVPETEYSNNIDIVNSLGTDQIELRLKFKVYPVGVAKIMGGDRDRVNKAIVAENVEDITATLHEPVDLITDFSIRAIIKSMIKEEISKQIQEGITKAGTSSTPADIMRETEMNDEYFTNFSYALYDAANADGSTVDSVNEVLFSQIDLALLKADSTGYVDNGGFGASKKEEIKNNLSKTLNELQLIESDGTLKKLSNISYFYLANHIKNTLGDKIDDVDQLERVSGESDQAYCDRLVGVYVFTQTPDVFYKGVGGVALALFIGLFIFGAVWVFLFVFTLMKTLSKKPWTFFGPIFWAVGSLQLVLGLGLTIFGKFIFPKFNLSKLNLPISHIILAPRTYVLVPSILFLALCVLWVAYFVIKIIAKKQYKKEEAQTHEAQ